MLALDLGLGSRQQRTLTYYTAYLLEKSLSVVCESWVARLIPITPVMRGGSFWIRQDGRVVATPLLVALVGALGVAVAVTVTSSNGRRPLMRAPVTNVR